MEEVEFQCGSCNQQLKIQIEDRDKWIRCPGCSAVQMFPGMRGPEETSIDLGTESNYDSQRTHYEPGLQSSSHGQPIPAGNDSHTGSSLNQWSVMFPDGTIWSEVTREELEQWIREGTVSDQCFFLGPTYSDWTPVSRLFQSETGTKPNSNHPGPPLPPASTWHTSSQRPPSRSSGYIQQSSAHPGGTAFPAQPISDRPRRSSFDSDSRSQQFYQQRLPGSTENGHSKEFFILTMGILSICTCCFPLGPIGLLQAYWEKKREMEGVREIRHPFVFFSGVFLCFISTAIFILFIFSMIMGV